MIVDDDIFMHIPNLMEYHQEWEQMGVQDFWIGHVHHGATAIMNKSSKYNLFYEMYQPQIYPDYGASNTDVISSDIVAKVYEVSQIQNSSLYIDGFMGPNKMEVVPQYHVFLFSWGI
jgi:beta-1,3-N-acetylglucosaminyltransferase 5